MGKPDVGAPREGVETRKRDLIDDDTDARDVIRE
jgi:hypothetical protein